MVRLLMIGKLLSLLTGASAVAQQIKVTNTDEQNLVYKQGTDLIVPYMQLLDNSPKVTEKARDDVRRGIKLLDAVTEYNRNSWSSFWIKGMGYRVLGDKFAANAQFKESFSIQKENPDVAREYAQSCLELGRGEEAAEVDLHAIDLSPNDAGLYANLALAYLFCGRNQDAKDAITKSLKMMPDDKISQAVQKVVEEVISGRRKKPASMADLSKKLP